MKDFWSCVTNNEFTVCCTGQTVYLFDKDGIELGKFRDLIYAYHPMISPDGTQFIIKSTDGRLAVYSLETFSLIKKFRFSKINGSQDDGFCFSTDGRYFINIERQVDALHCAISVYDTSDFTFTSQVLLNGDIMISHIEFDEASDKYYVLGFKRNKERVISHGFIGIFEDNQIKNAAKIQINEHNFLHSYKNLELMGFTEKAYKWSYLKDELDELKNLHLPLANLYRHYNDSSVL